MLLTVSSLVVILYTSVCVLKIYFNRKNLANMTGMTAAMLLGMMSSIALGLIVGLIFANNLTLSTIIAMVFGILVGILAGKTISPIVMLEGIGAGVMGGMMGAMLGDMLPQSNYNLMLVFMNIVFIISILLIFHVINVNNIRINKDSNFVYNTRIYPWVITSVISAILIFTFSQLDTNSTKLNEQVDEGHHHRHE